jgi:hypothetical protein
MGGEEDAGSLERRMRVEGGNEDELEFVWRQTRMSHMVAPPTVPAREDGSVLIKPFYYR